MRAIRWLAFAMLVLAAFVVAAWLCFRTTETGQRLEAAIYERATAWLEPDVIRITFDPGGIVADYIERYNHLRAAGSLVVIDGLCISACTMVTGLIRPDRVCVTPFAQLAFHSASTYGFFERQHSSEGTRLVWATYPERVRALLLKKGWNGDQKPEDAKGKTPAKTNEHPDLIYVAGDELRTLIRPCAAGEG